MHDLRFVAIESRWHWWIWDRITQRYGRTSYETQSEAAADASELNALPPAVVDLAIAATVFGGGE